MAWRGADVKLRSWCVSASDDAQAKLEFFFDAVSSHKLGDRLFFGVFALV